MNSRAERDRQHAHECAEMARTTIDSHIQRACLVLEKQWLMLAKQAEERPQFWLRASAFGRKANIPSEQHEMG
jgi:hypothetical protein